MRWLFVFGGLVLLSAPIYAESDLELYKQHNRVTVDTAKAELCFVDVGDCYPVLIGKTTPKVKFPLNIYTTDKPGYGGDIIGFKQERDFLFALHRVWTRKPKERRLERIASSRISDRVMTNGCINVTDSVYERLKDYFFLDVI